MRHSYLAAACAAAALVLTACGGPASGGGGLFSAGGSGAGSAFTSTSDMAAAVVAATNAKDSAKLTVDSAIDGQRFSSKGGYIGAAGHPRISFQSDIAAAAAQMGVGSLPGMSGTAESRFIDDTMYIQIPAIMERPAQWLKVPLVFDAADLKAVGGPDLGSGTVFLKLDVNARIKDIGQAGTITGSSPDTVDGAPATRYDIVIDPNKLTYDDPKLESFMKAMIEQDKASPEETVWLNAQNLIVRVREDDPDPKGLDFDVHYSDWGTPIDIPVPPADQITGG